MVDDLELQEKELQEQARQLEEKLRAIRVAREESRKEAEKQILLTLVGDLNNDYEMNRIVLTQNPVLYQEDLVKLFQRFPSRKFHGDGINSLKPQEWQIFLDSFEVLNNKRKEENRAIIVLSLTDGTAEKIGKLLNTPDYHVKLSDDKKKLEIEINPLLKDTRHRLYNFEGLKQSYSRFFLPIVEGYRLWEESQKWEKTIWDEDAKEYVLKDLEGRSKLDRLWDTDETNLAIELRGTKLRTFQNQTIEFLDLVGGSAIIAHPPGKGKTICGIGFKEYKKLKTCLVICPAALKTNWARHIERLTGERAMLFSGSTPNEFDIFTMVSKTPSYCIINYDVVGKFFELKEQTEFSTKTTQRNYWVDLINAADFDLIILDESHRIKNVKSGRSQAARMLKAKHFICLTGTPVMNRPGELWAPLTLISPNEFPSYENFLYTYTYDGKTPKNSDLLRKTLRRMMFRKEPKNEITPIERVDDFHELSPEARKIYEGIMAGIKETLNREGEVIKSDTVTSILAQIMYCKQICSIDKVDRVADMATNLADEAAEEVNNKVLIFSQFKDTVYAISQRLGNEVVVITGDIEQNERTKIVDRFQTDPSVKFLVGTWQTMGEGLDMTKAGYVIFADLFWTPANHQQCEHRAYGRLNDMHSIVSYYCVADKTIENWIQDLLRAKLDIIGEVVDGVSDPSESIANNLIKLIRESR